MTFSLIARCAQTGQFGIVISSSSPAVAARCAHTRAGVGAVASQNITDPALGPLLLGELAKAKAADQALSEVIQNRQHIDYRQLLVIDATGKTAVHSGTQVLGTWAAAQGIDCAAGGNLLANPRVPQAMISAFQSTQGHLGDRLIAALTAGLAAGGEAGPVHSAGMKISDKLDWPLVDLRIDWSDTPIQDLEIAWAIYRPQMAAYVQRAQDPTQAPSYGVPGDE
ncbi:DUF1028 domain-containing protein [Cypionkella sp.]|uniref:DUF1028 domain-containing protein n=1 Tax=Cypionkella sp. TaxID=2811411 RepID=UPI00261A4649|nr:DUF1028 domain-containing protein [Cypionkella sp.]MDB5664019.1 Fimbrial assembly protein FimA [Cypionkella sp.]